MGKAAQTRQLIIEKSAPVFNTKGYAGTSLNDLIEATGLTKGALYGNFEDKDAIALAALEYNLAKVIQGFARMMEGRTHALDRMRAFTDYYRKLGQKNIVLLSGCPIVNTAPEVDDTHPELREKVNEAIQTWRHTIIRILVKGMGRGEVRDDLNPSQFASQFIALIEGSVLLAKSMGDLRFFNDAIELADKMIDHLRKS